jgi:FMN-dependent oxidoreductase (nitrilotriacetate monooxygenase family)
MFHMGWYTTGWSIQTASAYGWTPLLNGVFAGAHEREWMKPDLYVDLATSLERAGFDFLLTADGNHIGYSLSGSAEAVLRLGIYSPRNDPMPLMPILAQRTKHLGLVPTVSSTFYPPFLAARLFATLDHISEGRMGFNLVTSYLNEAAQNYGLETIPPKEQRYDMAAEWIDIFKGLLRSWEPDAIVADYEKAIFADHMKVHRLDYVGKYFRCRGPLNTMPGPQGAIPMIEAGNSPPGRDLAARQGDALMANVQSLADMKSLREDMHRRLRSYGRDPSSFKLLYLVRPIIGDTDEDARRQAQAIVDLRFTPEYRETQLFFLGQLTGLDLGHYDLEMPCDQILAELKANKGGVERSSAELLFKGTEGKTLGDMLSSRGFDADLGLIGSPETVAAKMDELMQEVGGDGFLFTTTTTRRAIAEVADGLAPALRRRGLIRDSYESKTFRENLLAF